LSNIFQIIALLFIPCHVAALFTKLCRDEFKENNKKDANDEDAMIALLLFEKFMDIVQNDKVEIVYENVQEGKF